MSRCEQGMVYHLLVVQEQNEQRAVILKEETGSIGRDSRSSIVLDDPTVSRQHATLLRIPLHEAGQYQFRLMDGSLSGERSSTGLFVNGQACLSHDLQNGDLIQFGEHVKAKYYIVYRPPEYSDSSVLDDPSSFLLSQDTLCNKPFKEMNDATLTRLASFPELIPNPIIELTVSGTVTYLNPAAIDRFPDLKLVGAKHPLLADLPSIIQSCSDQTLVCTTQLGEVRLEQSIHFLSESGLIRVYITDITERNQIELDLRRRDRLLREVIAAQDISFAARFNRLIKLGCEWFGLPTGVLAKVQGNQLDILATRGLRGGDTTTIDLHKITSEAGLQFLQRILQTPTPMKCANVVANESIHALTPNASVQCWPIAACLGTRILVNVQVYGFLVFSSPIPSLMSFRAADQELLQMMAQWAGGEIERQQSQTALQQQLRRMVLLKQITQEIRQSLDTQRILQTAVDEMGRGFEVNRCVIHAYIEQPEPQIPCVAEYLTPGTTSMLNIPIPIQGNLHAQTVLTQDAAVVSDDVVKDPLTAPNQAICEKLDLKSMLAIRTSYQGQPNGILVLHQCDRIRHWLPEDIGLFQALADQVGLALAQARLLEQETLNRQQLARQNKALAIAQRDSEAANRAKSQFLATMSHEIRTPMNAVIGMTECLMETALNPEQQYFVETISRSGDALMTLLNDVLDLSKIESGKLELDLHPLEINRCIQEVLNILRPRAVAKGLILEHYIDPSVPEVIVGDLTRLRQVLMNLISNAIKFTETGQIFVSVTAEAVDNSACDLLFSVQDTGIGLSPEQQSLLFQPFSQLDASITRKYGGTGLGLAISQQLVVLMGGDIWARSQGSIAGIPSLRWLRTLARNSEVSSDSSPGSTFFFTVLAQTAEVSDLNLHQQTDRILLTQLNSDLEPIGRSKRKSNQLLTDVQMQRRILVAEDNRTNQTVILLLLKNLGYEADVVNSGLEVLDALRSQTYDVVLLDVEMPGMDGLTAARTICEEWPITTRPYLIAVTAYAMMDDCQRCLDAGMNDFLTKPLRSRELQQAFERAGLASVMKEVYVPVENSAITDGVLDAGVLQSLRQMGGEQALTQIVNQYLEDAPVSLQGVQDAIATTNPEALRQSAHTLRSSSANLGALTLAELCKQLEALGKTGTTDGADLAPLLAEYPRVEAALQQAFQRPHEQELAHD